MKTILLPTDFSANSQNAIHYAISMFGSEKTNFILLNAYRITPVNAAEYVSDIMKDFELKSERELKSVVKEITKKFPNKKLNIEIISKLGYPVQAMDKIAAGKNVDLIVMGIKGASGIKEVLIGSNTADAIKNLSCPVLAVPENAKYKTPKNIAFAADFREIEKEVILSPLTEIAKKFKSEILILHVSENGKTINADEALQEIKIGTFFGEIPHLLFAVENSNPVEGIENFVKTRNVDMLAMVARKHGFIENFFNKSVSRKLAMHTHIPLLVLQNK